MNSLPSLCSLTGQSGTSSQLEPDEYTSEDAQSTTLNADDSVHLDVAFSVGEVTASVSIVKLILVITPVSLKQHTWLIFQKKKVLFILSSSL